MSELIVKICGLRELAHARAAVEAGADAIGFVFAPTRRYVSPDRVTEMIRVVPTRVRKVGLFVDAPAETVRTVVQNCGLDFAQLCGDETVDYCRNLGVPAIKSIRVRGDDVGVELARYADVVSWCILDGFQPNAYGGTGTTFDWGLAARYAGRFRIMIAGGLTAENVASAVRIAQPWGVDVSSGVETAGQKDVAKIEAFVTAARAAWQGAAP